MLFGAKEEGSYCYLPTPMILASWGSPMFPLMVHQSAFQSIWPAVTCVGMLQRGHSGDGCVLASTLCKYDLRKGDCLF